jgi:hypothetical protein
MDVDDHQNVSDRCAIICPDPVTGGRRDIGRPGAKHRCRVSVPVAAFVTGWGRG